MKNFNTLYLRRFSCLALMSGLLSLQACAPLLVGGFVEGTLVASDRRTSGIQLEDQGIEIKANNRVKDALGDKAHVTLYSYNRQVLVLGEVANERDAQYAIQVVSQVENVKSVVNELKVAPFASFSAKTQDLYLASKVKANLVDTKNIYATAFKVVAYQGTVYLMGRVTQREADIATQVARNASGVSKVVKVFEILSEEELKSLMSTPVKAPSLGSK
jgi:osmotically-inducible protein OsmY